MRRVTRVRAMVRRDEPKIPRVGYLGTNIGPASLPPIEAFREGLRQLGYTEGQNIIIEYRWVRGPGDPVAAANAGELVSVKLPAHQGAKLCVRQAKLARSSR